ncbi:hypothetical protein [Sphingobium yanoikuyae]|uniref:hypothetical protein n=1 Tax=Sphingobium yanoikuyae TaxID=13690 RepID=UPI0028AC874B|nr:hypothetical protein [Sphingobium yanoikuyae]
MLSIAFGALIALLALALLPSTVSNEEMTALPYGGGITGTGKYVETYNLPRAQLRELVFQGGIALFIAGTMLFVGGALDERLRSSHARSRRYEHAKPATEVQPSSQAEVYPSINDDEAHRNKMIMAAIMLPVLMIIAIFIVTQLRLT